MDEVKILARGNLPLPLVRSAVLLSQLFVSLLAVFGEGSRVMARPVREVVVGSLFGQTIPRAAAPVRH